MFFCKFSWFCIEIVLGHLKIITKLSALDLDVFINQSVQGTGKEQQNCWKSIIWRFIVKTIPTTGQNVTLKVAKFGDFLPKKLRNFWTSGHRAFIFSALLDHTFLKMCVHLQHSHPTVSLLLSCWNFHAQLSLLF